MRCGRDDQVRRPTDAGREGGRRTVVRASVAALSDATGQFPVPDGSEAGTGGRPGAGSFYSSVSRTRRVCAEREVHYLAIPDCHELSAELAARSPLPETG